MSFEIRVNGASFALWKSAIVRRSMDNNAGVFRFSSSSKLSMQGYPVKAGDFVEILINNVRKISGFVDEVRGGQSEDTHTVTVSGRDNIADLIDSSIPDSAKVTTGPVSLKSLCEKVIKVIGARIKVINTVSDITDFTDTEIQAAGSGETCMAYLVSFARKKQVYLVPDGSGNLLIYRPDKAVKSAAPILHQLNGRNNNVVSYSFRQSQANRFNTYLCRSQDNFGFDPFADYTSDGTDRKNTVTDGQIRVSRYMELQAEETMDEQACLKRADEEANIRRIASTEYTAVVHGTEPSKNTLWDFGQFVDVIDDFADVTGKLLIKSVEYAVDTIGGTRTSLTCVPPDAYQVTAEPSKENRRTAKTGDGFQQTTPQTQPVLR